MTLTEWLVGREVITVAQDGSGDFKTIHEALAALKSGQAVKILDRGPYRDQLDANLPEDVGIISTDRAVIELPEWTRWQVSDARVDYSGHSLRCSDGLRMSGLTFTGPRLPEDCFGSLLLDLVPAGQVTIESCSWLQHSSYKAAPAVEGFPKSLNFAAALLVRNPPGSPEKHL